MSEKKDITQILPDIDGFLKIQISPHLKRVDTLPCEILMSENYIHLYSP